MEICQIAGNRVPIYYYPNEALHGFCLCLYLRAGALYEADADNGITHFFEHAVFRSLNRRVNGGLYALTDRLGLAFNACTYRELVQFSISGASEHFAEAAQIIAGLFEPLELSGAEVEMERRRIKAELRESDEQRSLDYFASRIVWKDTTLCRSIMGPRANLDRMGPERLAAAQRDLLTAENCFFYVTGRATADDVAALSRAVSRHELSPARVVRDNMAPRPAEFFQRQGCVAVKNADYTCVRFSFDADVRRYSEPERMLLYDILFAGDSCKVYQELSEKTGYIYDFDACFERYRNLGALSFFYEVQPAHLYDSIDAVVALLRALKRGLTDELELVRARYVDNALLLLDNAEELNWTMAFERHILDEPYPDLAGRRAAFAAVDRARIERMARELFAPQNLVLAVKGDKRRLDVDRLREQTARL